MLSRYLHGHLFKLEHVRIERHLRTCVVCYSQYQALKRAHETQRLLKDITPPEGMVQIMKERVSGIGKLKKLLYRPLWIVGILVVVSLVVYYIQKPRQLDVELDSIAKSAPEKNVQPAPVQPTPVAAPKTPETARPEPARASDSNIEPLVVTITSDNDKAAIRRINEVMRGHEQLRKFKLTDTVREISGSLTTKELLTFLNRIESVGKITYNRKQFDSFPAARPIPFAMKVVALPRVEKPVAHEQAPAKTTKNDAGAVPVSASTATQQ